MALTRIKTDQVLDGTITNADLASDIALTTSADISARDITSTRTFSGSNAVLTGYLRGPASFTIDPATHGDNNGVVIIAGDLQVDGTTTTVNSTTMDVADLNITLASGAGNAAAADGAGLTVDGANATITYDGTNDEWDFNKDINVTGNITVSGTVDGRDVATDGTKLDGIESGATADQTASEILTSIKTVDGSGSGLDADTLDGVEGSSYLRSDANDTATGQYTFTDGSGPAVSGNLGSGSIYVSNNGGSNVHSALQVHTVGGLGIAVQNSGNVGIGTNNPGGLLDVQTSANRYFRLKSTNADLELLSDNNTNPVFRIQGTGTADLVNIYDNTQEVFTILDGGNVGIGNPNPAYDLDVTGQGRFTTDIRIGSENLRLSTDGSGEFGLGYGTTHTTANRVRVYQNTTPVFGVRDDGAIDTEQVRHSIRPTLNLDFANSKELDSRITFYRDSIATYYDSKGILRYSNINEPRFDHDPATGESKGLLIEEQRTNLLTYSEDFTNAAWTLGRVTITPYQVVAPDGTLSASKLIPTTENNNHQLLFYVQNTTLNTSSIFVKAGELSKIAFRDSWDGSAYASFDLTTETVLAESQGSGSINSIGNGWYRISFTLSSAQNYAFAVIPLLDSYTSGTPYYNFSGDGYSGIYIWGAQLEVGSFPTSYVPSDTRFTSRSSAATYYDETGILRTAPANSPRYGYKYDGRKWVETGLILEDAATNIYPHRADINSGFGQTAVTVTANQATAPDGSYTAKTIVDDSSTGIHRMTLSAFTSTDVETHSIFLKSYSGNRRVFLNLTGALGVSATVDLETGTIVATNLISNNSHVDMEEVGNGWYRFFLTGTGTNVLNRLYVSLVEKTHGTSNDDSYTGDGSSGVYVWGYNRVVASSGSSFIYDGNSTRSADVASSVAYTREAEKVEMYNIDNDWYNQDEGTFYSDSSALQTNGRIIDVNYDGQADQVGGDTTKGSLILIHNTNTPLVVWNGSNAVVVTGPNQIDTGKMAFRYGVNDFAVTANGIAPETDTSGNVPLVTQLNIGGRGVDTDTIICGHVRTIRYYDTKFTDAELQALTENN